jgi:alcohol dehydrogenase (cytochrome c)
MKARLLAMVVALIGVTVADAQVSFERLLRTDQEPQNWLMYSGNTKSHRYTPLTQMTPANVNNLELQWMFQAQSLEKFEATPLVVDGVLYTVQAPNDVVALDAITGRIFWTYSYAPSPKVRPCCGRINRGVAILGETIFMGTLDGHVVALDSRTGRVRWNTAVDGARPEAGYVFTVAPQIVKDKVIIGVAGGDFGVRGFLLAFDAKTGKEIWRFYTTPGPGEPGHETWSGESWLHGGAPVWVTGSYDPDLNLTYWGLGNPGPDWNGDGRIGDNLYSDSVVALNPDTGKLRWYFQFTPHDEFDYDSTQVPVLADVEWRGRLRQVMLFANRNGFFYVLDRATGEFLLGKPYVKVTWATGLDEKGRPKGVLSPTMDGARIEPSAMGGTNWFSPSYSPHTGLFYVSSALNTSSTFRKKPGAVDFVEGQPFIGTFPGGGEFGGARLVNRKTSAEGHGAVQAIDPQTGDRKWMYELTDLTQAGIVTTAADLLFTGSNEGYFYALDARTGGLLWRASVGGQVASGPISYSVRGRQYVAVAAGNVVLAYALRQ